MKPLFLVATACLAAGCASNDVSTSSPGESISDQPQTSVAGEGSLMPGAYETRRMQTGQFTGRERTNDQIGQRPTLPRDADPRELARSEDSLGNTGAGTLGQSGIVPDQAVSTETLMETTSEAVIAPAHVTVTPPASQLEQEQIEDEAIGSAPAGQTDSASSTNSVTGSSLPER